MDTKDIAASGARPLPARRADGVKALLADERAAILDRCTRCGKCFEACPMTPYAAALAGADAPAVAGGVYDIVDGAPGTPQALAWTMICTKSGVCDRHCPEGISPRMMLRLARITVLGGLGQAPQVPVKEDPDYFAKVHAFARLQLPEDERLAWTVAPRPRPPSRSDGGRS